MRTIGNILWLLYNYLANSDKVLVKLDTENNNNNNNSNSSNKNSGKVQTGDRNNLVFPLIGMTAAILAIATVLIIRKKKRL